MAIIKYSNDWFDLFDELGWWLPSSKWRCVYDPERYELVPKESYKKELIEQKEKELKLLDEKRKLLSEDVEKLKAG